MVKMGQNACRWRRAHGKACRETPIRCFEAEIQSQGVSPPWRSPFCRRARKTRLYERGKTQGHLDRVRGEKSGRRVAWESAVPNADRVNDWVKLYKEKGESDSDPTPLAFLEVKAFPFGAVLLLYKAKRQKRLICGVFFIPFVLRRISSIGIPSKSPRRF